MFRRVFSVLAAVTTFVAAPVWAHEFWIDPVAFQVETDADLVADIRVGQDYKGAAYSYFPQKFHRFDIVHNGTVTAVPGRAGDRPALTMPAPGEGLIVVAHVTTDLTLTYTEWDKFVNFCTHKDFTWALERHKELGLPDTKFKEAYSRHAKSLIAVGDGAGQDTEVGLVTEIVALANPYTDDLAAGLPVKVLYNGAVRADTQVEVFEKAPDGTVITTLHRTDNKGIAIIPVKAGHAYLVDSVVMRELEALTVHDPVWESLWASLTFQMP